MKILAAIIAWVALLAAPAEASTLYVSEFQTGVATIGSQQAQVPPQPSLADQAVAVSGTTAASAAFSAKTHYVTLICDVGCSVSFGATPTATTNNFLLQQGMMASFGVVPGQAVAVIANAAGNTSGGSISGSVSNASSGVATSATNIGAVAWDYSFNGSTWDQTRDATNGLNSVGTGLLSSQSVGQCDDTSPVATTENSFGNVRLDCAAHGLMTERLPSASASVGIAAVVSSALETGHVLKASAGNLYSVEVATTTVAGYLEVFNSTTVPAAGAVTPVASCYVGAFGTCALNFDPPLVMATGISVAFSASTTPFTKTDSATAFLSGQTQ